MILGIDTTSDWSSVALDDDEIVWSGDRNQSKELLPKIEELMQRNNVSFVDLTGIVVVNGPGSYTGIRIGVSVANTIGMIMGVPVRGIDSLLAQIEMDGNVSVLSAGGSRVYGRKYLKAICNNQYAICNEKNKTNIQIKEDGDFFVGEIVEFLDGLDKDVCIVGEVNEEVENYIKSSGWKCINSLGMGKNKGRARGAVWAWDDLPAVANDNVIPMYLREAVRGQVVRSK
jgi:tRNA threonylcarbamoyl adenosine modification protein YeaZ